MSCNLNQHRSPVRGRNSGNSRSGLLSERLVPCRLHGSNSRASGLTLPVYRSDSDSELFADFSFTQRGKAKCPAVQFTDNPLLCGSHSQERSAKSSGNVRFAFAPIDAGICEPTTERANSFDVDSKPFQLPSSDVADFVCALCPRRQPPFIQKSIVQCHRQRSCQVVIATAGSPQRSRCARHEGLDVRSGEDAQTFENSGDLWTPQRIVSVPTLGGDADQLVLREAIQVGTCCRGSNFGDCGEFCTRACMSIQ